ncbi:MAG: CusA/CzcA family heavy metal efflux RND transporter [Schleiferiaceae bacterium]|nr:CusA/CzcA family heavy metal efflux RND transporter [Schleiferiaceae bacterium]
MFTKIIETSLNNKFVTLLLVFALVLGGLYALQNIAIDAVPDITNNQVQVVTTSPSLAPQEVEQFITYPLEIAMANLPDVEEIRSISRYGLSVVTIVFHDHVPTLDARQYVKEKIDEVRDDIPQAFGTPELMPITTGLGEIYQYVLKVAPGYEEQYDAMELRTIQDWIVKRQLAGVPGIVEVSSFGGYLKQYEVAINPRELAANSLSLTDVFNALEANNQNTGGSYIEKGPNALYIRAEGLVTSLEEVEKIAIVTRNGIPLTMKDVGTVRFGAPPRFGAMTMDGEGETVGGITLMLKGENAYETNKRVAERIREIEKSLPEGVSIYAYLERSSLIQRAITTVRNNLLEGGAIVIIVLIVLLGNFRAGLIVASIIPLSLLFALIMMYIFDVSANLMSLGAIDFGIVVDGAVIIVENLLQVLTVGFVGQRLTQEQMDAQILKSSANIYKSAAFGVLIIIVVFLPVLSLSGIEGKMFKPMAQTVSFALIGALLLSLTYVPVISSLVMKKTITPEKGLPHRIMKKAEQVYQPILKWALRRSAWVVAGALVILSLAIFTFVRMGSEFIPDLEEGDLAVQVAIQPGSSLNESIATATKVERILKEKFPEVKHVVSKIGTAEIPTDPMAMEDMDIMVILKDKSEWTSASNREALVELMKEELEVVLGIFNEFSQPIQLRFNELMTGAKTDIAVKIYGEDLDVLFKKANEAAEWIERIPGAGDVKVEQTEGLPQLMIRYDRDQLARYGVTIQQINDLIQTAYAGRVSGTIYEGQRRFDLVVRLNETDRRATNLSELFVTNTSGQNILVSELVNVTYEDGPMQISRDNTQRRITIGVNVRNRDVASLVEEISTTLDTRLSLPPGYSIRYGGQFENLVKARGRLAVAVPIALAMIFVLLYFAFGKVKYTLMIGASVPFSAIGGVGALYLRDMPFSISAGIGFIALFGVAVLNGIVLIAAINQLRDEEGMDAYSAVIEGTRSRLRPVLMTGLVAALGFLPMALSTGAGAEVQKPLATVVIGGIFSDTILTLLLLPILYLKFPSRISPAKLSLMALPFLLLVPQMTWAQQQPSNYTLEAAIEAAKTAHPSVQNARLRELQAAEERKKAIQLDPIDASYQYGQFNTRVYDYYVEVNQNFGSLLQHIQRGGLARELVSLRQSERILSERELEVLVRSAWYDWLTRKQAFASVSREVDRLQQFLDRVALLAESGDISILEQRVFQARLAQYQNIALQQEAALAQTENAVLILTGWEVIDEPEGALLPLPTPALSAPLNPVLLSPQQQQIAVSKKQLAVERAAFFPELTAGYFNQEIERIPNFQGVMVGLQFPLWFRPQQAQIKQARLQVAIAENDYRFTQISNERERQTAAAQVAAAKKQWENYGAFAKEQAESIAQTALLSYEAGEIDFFRLAESLRTVMDLQLETIEILNNYNQAVLRFEFFTK